MSRLVVVSNRVAKPDTVKGGAHGGLAVGVFAAMEESGGIWFGWNGRIENRPSTEVREESRGNIDFITVGLRQNEYKNFYLGYSNNVIWPLFHQRPDLMRYRNHYRAGYLGVNRKFANHLLHYLKPDDTIWIHDYQLIPMAKMLREAGVKSKIGFFLHTPFPAFDLLRALPYYDNMLDELLNYDLVGFHTPIDQFDYHQAIEHTFGGTITETNHITCHGHEQDTGVYPIGVDPEDIETAANKGVSTKEYLQLREELGDRKLIIGVDRLDYSKGIFHRFQAYDQLLKNNQDLHRKLVYMQVAPTSRGDVKAYEQLAKQVEQSAGHVNGTYADFDWTPLRYINRGFRRSTVIALYNMSHIGFVTPLRDGMNLVAKEYVAAQNPEDPGVLVLSKMAGAAYELDAALIVNPYDTEAVADTLAKAIRMPLDERIDRWKQMMAIIRKNDIVAWQRNFRQDLRHYPHKLF
ncbi:MULTISPECIES: alpha,alpha-trehalose-phosphate synthase (UDP-forming) [Vibrio]|uniref:Trehalose-6-phosphate synthase n=2 Tax=Vibrio TaxID=662 RepID=A0A7X4LKK1_9VIBR|nr:MULTISPECIES: trehalose-6-phosphate synthase [Vibrio]MBF9000445.1 trehalose-6-phosphate synthase [Vibrio nitrifigilis]MZI93286.1 alpha,alpha-trehalose-phosphate synthase [Vibrio eleionomae]